MTVYRTYGTLTGTIQPENIVAAQTCLQEDDMTKYVSDNAALEGVLEFVEWSLQPDGHNYHITAVTNRPLTQDELKQLSEECSGQNSDGLGEGFEQQAFAELSADCGECDGCEQGYGCDEYGGMISFDWETNKLEWVVIK